jgi:hypothetical protein
MGTSFGSISTSEVDRYNEQLDFYFQAMEKYFCALHALKEVANRTIAFTIEIRNSGTAPADDVDVLFRFPDGFRLMVEEDLPKQPSKPRPPEKPVSSLERLVRGQQLMSYLPRPNTYMPSLKPISSFKIEETNSYDVTDHFRRIKHGVPVTLPKLYAQFASFVEAHSFNCEYELRPANAPSAFIGRLDFVVRMREE